jgi:hypothetical protein
MYAVMLVKGVGFGGQENDQEECFDPRETAR